MATPSDLTSAGVPPAPGAPPSSPNPATPICSRDLAFARRFLEVHGDPGQRTHYSLPTEQWRLIYGRVEQCTNSTSALLELNPLDDQDQRDLDRQELREFRQQQPSVLGPLSSFPRTSPLVGDSSPPPRAPVTKKTKATG
ncbi:MAG: hypothetical protein NXY57DRAFT_970446 [Lentinula lateritia]|nr:MAG: hypothetical protein NXY57DRAFT_970446 [Lentinula lateritia]